MASKFGSWRQKLKLHPWLQKIRQHPFIVTGVIVVIFALIVFSFAVSIFGWDWTGFSSGESKTTITSTSNQITTAKELQAGKTLWDWLGLLATLAIPVAVGFGAAWFTAQQGKVSDAERKDNQRETRLQAYLDRMTELLLKEGLRASEPESEVRKIARVRTLTALCQLDSYRNGYVLTFLHETGLVHIDNSKSIIDLSEADLGGVNLSKVNLSKVNLNQVNLRGANLSGADLREANLKGASLNGAILSGTRLQGANLSQADLSGTDLSGADLSGADLSEANLGELYFNKTELSPTFLSDVDLIDVGSDRVKLSCAKVTQDQLEKAKSLRGTIMPDGSKQP